MTADSIHLFLNPTAGRGRAGQRQQRILELFAEGKLDVSLHASRGVGDLESAVLRIVREGATRIVVAGGDGSIHEAVNGLLQSENPAALGVIPTGTGNDFAKACGIPLAWEHATKLLIDRLVASETPRKVDVGQCNQRYFANGAGIGFDAEVTEIARAFRWPIGDLVYLLAIFQAMRGGIATPYMHISAENFSWDGPLTLANISNGPWIGGLFHIAPMARNDDQQFELLIAKPVTRRRIVKLLPMLIKGTHIGEPDIVHAPVRELTIRTAEAVPSHLDGEVQAVQTEFRLAVLPDALNLL